MTQHMIWHAILWRQGLCMSHLHVQWQLLTCQSKHFLRVGRAGWMQLGDYCTVFDEHCWAAVLAVPVAGVQLMTCMAVSGC